jgi:hypothetical protein
MKASMLADNHTWIDITLWIWFSLTALSAIYVAVAGTG